MGRPGFWRRFGRHRLAMAGLVAVLFITAASALGPLVSPYKLLDYDLKSIGEAPSWRHPLGTDDLGRDVLTRLMYGGRISLTVGVSAVLISSTVGIVLGAIAGFGGPVTDMVIMRITDVMLSIPTLLLVIAIMPLLGASLQNVVLILGVATWPAVCRVARGQILSIRNEPYVEAAQAAGARPWRIILRHVLPNGAAPLMVSSTLGVAHAILAEASLSFLGLGVPPTTPTWGNMLHTAQSLQVLVMRPWEWLSPGLAVALTVLAVNYVGDGLRDALDPRWSGRSKG